MASIGKERRPVTRAAKGRSTKARLEEQLQMAKRMVTDFSRVGFPSYQEIDEEGQAKPAIYGVPWVSPDTLATMRKHGERRTGPKGEPWTGGQQTTRSSRS